MLNKYKQMLKEGYPGNPMRAILTMEAEAWEEGRRETLEEIRTIINACPDCAHEEMIIVLRKIRSLK